MGTRTLPSSLTFLLFASCMMIIASLISFPDITTVYASSSSDDLVLQVLQTNVPYYMAPHFWTYGGGVAPVQIGKEKCPQGVKFTSENNPGVPIIFSVPSGESIVIDDNTDVYISFLPDSSSFDSDCANFTTWGYPVINLQDSIQFITLGGGGSGGGSRSSNCFGRRSGGGSNCFGQYRFRIRKEPSSFYYSVNSYGTNTEVALNIVSSYDSEHDKNRLALVSDPSNLLYYVFREVKRYYDEPIKSAV